MNYRRYARRNPGGSCYECGMPAGARHRIGCDETGIVGQTPAPAPYTPPPPVYAPPPPPPAPSRVTKPRRPASVYDRARALPDDAQTELIANLTEIDVEGSFADSVRGTYGDTVQIGWLEYDPADAIKELDPVSWDTALQEYVDSMDGWVELPDGNHYESDDVEAELDRIEEELGLYDDDDEDA